MGMGSRFTDDRLWWLLSRVSATDAPEVAAAFQFSSGDEAQVEKAHDAARGSIRDAYCSALIVRSPSTRESHIIELVASSRLNAQMLGLQWATLAGGEETLAALLAQAKRTLGKRRKGALDIIPALFWVCIRQGATDSFFDLMKMPGVKLFPEEFVWIAEEAANVVDISGECLATIQGLVLGDYSRAGLDEAPSTYSLRTRGLTVSFEDALPPDSYVDHLMARELRRSNRS